jgi:hypothetical protein
MPARGYSLPKRSVPARARDLAAYDSVWQGGRALGENPSRREEPMKTIAMGIALSLYAVAALAAGPSCREAAAEKKLHGAAMTSFMTKCEQDAQASCDAAAQEKKLYGAAKTSFTKKCVKDATGA